MELIKCKKYVIRISEGRECVKTFIGYSTLFGIHHIDWKHADGAIQSYVINSESQPFVLHEYKEGKEITIQEDQSLIERSKKLISDTYTSAKTAEREGASLSFTSRIHERHKLIDITLQQYRALVVDASKKELKLRKFLAGI